MRVAIGEAVVRISRGYIACYRRSDGEDGTKRSLRSQQEETAMEDGGGNILFFLRSLFRSTLHHLNTWIRLMRGAKSRGKILPTSFFFFNAIVFVIIIDVKNV